MDYVALFPPPEHDPDGSAYALDPECFDQRDAPFLLANGWTAHPQAPLRPAGPRWCLWSVCCSWRGATATDAQRHAVRAHSAETRALFPPKP